MSKVGFDRLEQRHAARERLDHKFEQRETDEVEEPGLRFCDSLAGESVHERRDRQPQAALRVALLEHLLLELDHCGGGDDGTSRTQIRLVSLNCTPPLVHR